MTQQLPSLTGPQWLQGQSPHLSPLWLQGPSCLPIFTTWQSFTMSRALHPGIRLLRCLRPPSHTLAFLRPQMRRGGVGVPQFQGIRRIEIPVAACCGPGASGTTSGDSHPLPTGHHPIFGSGVSAIFTCLTSRSVNAGFSRQHRNQVWSVTNDMASRCRTFVPGLPTLTSATRERRPGRPYTVVHV